jgi:hypothetical protein
VKETKAGFFSGSKFTIGPARSGSSLTGPSQ